MHRVLFVILYSLLFSFVEHLHLLLMLFLLAVDLGEKTVAHIFVGRYFLMNTHRDLCLRMD